MRSVLPVECTILICLDQKEESDSGLQCSSWLRYSLPTSHDPLLSNLHFMVQRSQGLITEQLDLWKLCGEINLHCTHLVLRGQLMQKWKFISDILPVDTLWSFKIRDYSILNRRIEDQHYFSIIITSFNVNIGYLIMHVCAGGVLSLIVCWISSFCCFIFNLLECYPSADPKGHCGKRPAGLNFKLWFGPIKPSLKAT